MTKEKLFIILALCHPVTSQACTNDSQIVDGSCCSKNQLGVSMINKNKTDVLICLYEEMVSGSLAWKGFTGDTVEAIPTGTVAMYLTKSCPDGWTHLSGMDSRVPMGTSGTPSVNGYSSHKVSAVNGVYNYGFLNFCQKD